MALYPLLVFFHVLGAVALFAGLGIESVTLRRLARGAASVDEARSLESLLSEAARIGLGGMVVLLIAGVWMMAIRWGPRPWIVAALVGVGLMIVLGAGPTRRGRRRLGALLREDVPPSEGFLGELAGGSLMVSHSLRAAVAIGILALMTVKSDAVGSMVIIGTSVAVGLAMAIAPGRRASRPRTRPETT